MPGPLPPSFTVPREVKALAQQPSWRWTGPKWPEALLTLLGQWGAGWGAAPAGAGLCGSHTSYHLGLAIGSEVYFLMDFLEQGPRSMDGNASTLRSTSGPDPPAQGGWGRRPHLNPPHAPLWFLQALGLTQLSVGHRDACVCGSWSWNPRVPKARLSVLRLRVWPPSARLQGPDAHRIRMDYKPQKPLALAQV